MRIPSKITPCPIAGATIGINFEPSITDNAVFGIVYNAIKEKYPKVENLPILQIPEEIRRMDPNLRFQALHKVTGDGFVVMIGPRNVSLCCVNEYVGWEIFLKEAVLLCDKLGGLGIVKKLERLGLRYVNVFEFDVFDKITLNISINNHRIKDSKNHLRIERSSGDFENILQISNNASGSAKGKSFTGSVIDIDVYALKGLDNFFSQNVSLLSKAHDEEKKIFFGLLNADYLASLNPEYIGGE